MGHVAKSLALYKEFNAREPDFVTAIGDIDLPTRLSLLGRASKILYRSDKWRSDGKESFYIHPYESDVRCYVPWRHDLPEVAVRAWPGELVQLGHCIDLEVARPDGSLVYLTPPEGTILCATPDGRSLVLLHPGQGILGALTGGRQRVTDRGIDDAR
jgi:hypothetical protein